MLDQFLVSVLICTWNRAASLERTLLSLQNQTMDPDAFEVIVVDNNSPDDTAEVVRRVGEQVKYNLRYVFEEKTGKSHALNAGKSAVSAPLIACTDDDCIPEPDWLDAIVKAFDHPEVAVLGGPGLSVFPEEIKSDPRRLFLGRRFLGDFSPYSELTELQSKNLPLGLNMSYRKAVAEKVSYDPTLGPTGKVHICREETAFVKSAQALGFRVFFEPRAVVHHHLGGHRIDLPSILKQGYQSGAGTYLERYAPRVEGSPFKKLTVIAQFAGEACYSWLRYFIMFPSYKGRVIARFRATAAAGKLSAAMGKNGVKGAA